MNLSAALRARRAFAGDIPPAFLIRGARLVSNNPACVVRFPSQEVTLEPQDGRDPLAGPSVPLEPETPALAPSLQSPAPSPAALEALKADVEALAGRLDLAKRGIGDSGGLALTIQLRRLMQRHNLTFANPPALPLLEPIDAPSIKIRAIGATGDLDLSRTYFSANCRWPLLESDKIRLLAHHDEDRGPVGRIDELSFDDRGRLIVVATVNDKAAMQYPAISISAAIGAFAVRHADSPTLCAGEILEVTDVSEFSLTRTPANLACTIVERWIPNPVDLSYETMIAAVQRMQAMARQLIAA